MGLNLDGGAETARDDGPLGVAADALTDTEAELRRLNWALAAYGRSSSALIHFQTLDDLVASICGAIVAQEEYVIAAVGLADSGPGKPVRLLAGAGPALGYLDGLNLSWDESLPEGNGPTGRAIRSGESLIMRDALTEPMFAPWRERARPFGIRSSVTVPFRRDGRVVGVVLVYASRPHAFGPKELDLFSELGSELAFAMSVAEDRAQLKAAEAARLAAEDAAREAQAELARAGRLLSVGEFASSIAHEINQPVAAIITNGDAALRWLARDPPDLDEVRAAIERMSRDAKRASGVVARTRGLLAKSRTDDAPLDVNEVAEEVLLYTADERRRSQVSVSTDLASGLPLVRGDRIQLQQVMLNLILNAVDAMKGVNDRPRRLQVRSTLGADGEVLVEVEDCGVGLDPATSDHLFEHFFTTKDGGVGLGLPISRSIVEAHGGRLWAGPASPHGAVFRFCLPVAALVAA